MSEEYIVDMGDISAAPFSVLTTFLKVSKHADVREEIVRCRDCRHFTPKGTHEFENVKTNADYCKFIRGWMLQITPGGFCAWGERRAE